MTHDPLHALARETADTITREIFSTVMVPEVIKSRIEAALLHAQQVQREQDAKIVDELRAQWLTGPKCFGKAAIAELYTEVAATLRSQETPK